MPWSEFLTLLAGLNGETPLGATVRIRAEKDPKILKDFTPEQKRIRAQWRQRQSEDAIKHYDKNEYDKAMQNLAAMFRTMSLIE